MPAMCWSYRRCSKHDLPFCLSHGFRIVQIDRACDYNWKPTSALNPPSTCYTHIHTHTTNTPHTSHKHHTHTTYTHHTHIPYTPHTTHTHTRTPQIHHTHHTYTIYIQPIYHVHHIPHKHTHTPHTPHPTYTPRIPHTYIHTTHTGMMKSYHGKLMLQTLGGCTLSQSKLILFLTEQSGWGTQYPSSINRKEPNTKCFSVLSRGSWKEQRAMRVAVSGSFPRDSSHLRLLSEGKMQLSRHCFGK